MAVDPLVPVDRTVKFTTRHVDVDAALRAELAPFLQAIGQIGIDKIVFGVMRRIKTS